MSRDELIFPIGPLFFTIEECLPASWKLRGGLDCLIGDESSEALIETKSVPPFHGDQVPEPHMCHFMKNGFSSSSAAVYRYGCAVNKFFRKSNCCNVLHRSCVEVRHDHLIIFNKRIG